MIGKWPLKEQVNYKSPEEINKLKLEREKREKEKIAKREKLERDRIRALKKQRALLRYIGTFLNGNDIGTTPTWRRHFAGILYRLAPASAAKLSRQDAWIGVVHFRRGHPRWLLHVVDMGILVNRNIAATAS